MSIKKLKSPIKYAAILIVVISAVFAVDYVFLHILLPSKRLIQHPTLDVPFIKNENVEVNK